MRAIRLISRKPSKARSVHNVEKQGHEVRLLTENAQAIGQLFLLLSKLRKKLCTARCGKGASCIGCGKTTIRAGLGKGTSSTRAVKSHGFSGGFQPLGEFCNRKTLFRNLFL